MRLPLAAALLILSLPAAAAEHPCLPLPGVGCYFAPESAGANPPLLIYLRGHHPEHLANVPAGRALESARQAFDFYGLERVARDSAHAVLVTYRSGLAVSEADIGALSRASAKTFGRRTVAAHSGGYVGLGATLDNGLSFQQVIMLDSFYSSSPALAQKLQARFPSGSCRGFFTPHRSQRRDGSFYDNEANFNANFRPHAAGCAVDRLPEGQHNPGVHRCLPVYLRGQPCR
jgi:hypothetical protein